MIEQEAGAESSAFARLYRGVYGALCGVQPDLRIGHFQWAAIKDLRHDLHEVLGLQRGKVLDVGCGHKPYRSCAPSASQWFGIDIFPGPQVDLVVRPGEYWALPTAHFDVVLCTQVFEHVDNIDHVRSEIARVLKPGGVLILSVPFLYPVHGVPHDYRRFTTYGLRNLLRDDFEIVDERKEGAVGTTLAILVLTWLESLTHSVRLLRFLKALFLPVWIMTTIAINLAAIAGDLIDPTGLYYSNVLIIAIRRTADTQDE